MTNTVHMLASFYLLLKTGLSQDEFMNKFNIDTIVDSKIQFVLPDGSTYEATFASLEGLELDTFEEQEKATAQNEQ